MQVHAVFGKPGSKNRSFLYMKGKIFSKPIKDTNKMNVRIGTYFKVGCGGGGAGEEPRQHHVQRDVAGAPHVAVADLNVLDLCS